jgi:restriction endonuclease XhoI-like protein
MIDVEKGLTNAVKHFWRTRTSQHEKQGSLSGRKDAGNRAAVTGGKHADGFVNLIAEIVKDAEVPNFEILVHTAVRKHRTLPGYFRPCKEWDVVVLCKSDLLAVVEIKSQVGSFGNNFNNRVEEALGSAADFWMSYKNGNLRPSAKPWLGYLFMLEERTSSLKPTKRIELSPYPVDEEFQNLSYAQRYEIVCQRMVREMLYDSACFFTSNAKDGMRGRFKEPNEELSIRNFARSLHARAAAFAKIK